MNVKVLYSISAMLNVILLDGKIGCSSEDILNFFTGDKIPSPIGYKKIPTIKFLTGKFLTASLCTFKLRLPIDHGNYESINLITYCFIN
jgi:hypothetical protein